MIYNLQSRRIIDTITISDDAVGIDFVVEETTVAAEEECEEEEEEEQGEDVHNEGVELYPICLLPAYKVVFMNGIHSIHHHCLQTFSEITDSPVPFANLTLLPKQKQQQQ